MVNEKITDDFISGLLKDAGIEYVPNGTNIKEIEDALRTASKRGTGNAGFPEFVAKSNDFILVIEDKAETTKQALYLDDTKQELDMSSEKAITDYAENGALHYANHIIKNTNFKKIFAFGCSGNEKHHVIRPIFVDDSGLVLLNEVDNFENFNEKNIDKYYLEQVKKEIPLDILELEEVMIKAKELHEYLRDYGQLRETENPLVVSAILLALNENINIIDDLEGDQEVETDGEVLFNAIEKHLKRIKVQPETKKKVILNEFNLIKNRTLLNNIDKKLEKTPLKFFTEFIYDNIFHSAKSNSQQDILAKFYGQFIKYSGGDGQSLGIVLTPHHITELFCDLVNIQPDDVVFDPCCGTGSFLLTAMNKMIESADDESQIEHIKKEQIHGIETREDMFSIATTNMILRGDGKSNLLRDNFLHNAPEILMKKAYTVGFMNPPYSQSKNEDTWHLSEISFIEHLLDSLDKNARAVVIVPLSTMVGKNQYDKNIKKDILKKHTLEGVITLNPDTFYRIGTHPCIGVFTCHKPHPNEKYVKFIDFKDDGFEINKHIGLIETERAKERKKHLLDCWLHDKDAGNDFMVKSQIKYDDEWLHSFYYFNDNVPSEESFYDTVGDYLSFEFDMVMKGKEYLFKLKKTDEYLNKMETTTPFDLASKEWKEFMLKELFVAERGTRLVISDRKPGKTPFVTAGHDNQGISSYINNDLKIHNNSITIDMFGESFFRAYEFMCDDNILVLSLKDKSEINKYVGLFIANVINVGNSTWNYGKQYRLKTFKRHKIILPVNENMEPDYEFMEKYMINKEIQLLRKYNNYLESKKI